MKYSLNFSLRHPVLRSALCLASLASSFYVQAGVLEDSMGRWVGSVSVNGKTMRSGLELFQRADGTTGGEVIAIDNAFAASRLRSVTEKEGNLEIDGPRGMHLSLHREQKDLVGNLQQGPNSLPVKFQKVENFGEPMRAQTPRAPFSYQVQDLVLTSSDGTKLSATLTRPEGSKPVNAVVLIHGTGPEDRNQNEDGHQNFAVIADHLTRQGVAVLRFDKRGVKRSGGSFDMHTQADLVADVQAAIAALRTRKDVLKVGVIGHSEGGEIAARVAAQAVAQAAAQAAPAVDFLVSLAGPGLDLMATLDFENTKGMQLAGASNEEAQIASRIAKQFLTVVKGNADVKTRMTTLQGMMQALAKEERDILAKYRGQLQSLSPSVAATPWMYSALQSQPAQDWRQVKVPVLALNGEKDAQMSAKDNLAVIAGSLKMAGNKQVNIETLAGLNHNFQTAKTGSQEEYSQIDETIAPQVLQKISAFVLQQH